MDLYMLFLIAIGLGMDVFTVSIAYGFVARKWKTSVAMKLALLFGLFHFLMPVIGWFAGVGFRSIISNFDHWIAFGLLAFVGGKMIFEACSISREKEKKQNSNLATLLLLSIATSIDALSVGFSLSFLQVSIITPAIVIASVTFSLSCLGFFIGCRFGHFYEKIMKVVGGLILMGIGIKILIDHIMNTI